MSMSIGLRLCFEPRLDVIMECPVCQANIEGVDWSQVQENLFNSVIDFSICPHCNNEAPTEAEDDAVSRLAALTKPDLWKARVRAYRKVCLKKLGFWIK
jgi:hypothetical protein